MKTEELKRMINKRTGNFFLVVGSKDFANIGLRVFHEEGLKKTVIGIRIRVEVELPEGVELNVAPEQYIHHMFPKVKWSGGGYEGYRSYAFSMEIPPLTKEGIMKALEESGSYQHAIQHMRDTFGGAEFLLSDEEFKSLLTDQFKEVLDTMFPDSEQAIVFNFPTAKGKTGTSQSKKVSDPLEDLGFSVGGVDSSPMAGSESESDSGVDTSTSGTD